MLPFGHEVFKINLNHLEKAEVAENWLEEVLDESYFKKARDKENIRELVHEPIYKDRKALEASVSVK